MVAKTHVTTRTSGGHRGAMRGASPRMKLTRRDQRLDIPCLDRALPEATYQYLVMCLDYFHSL